MKHLFTLLLCLLGSYNALQAQALISANPTFPTDLDQTIITFNAALGSGGLADYVGDVYAHTGVITSLSTSDSDWRYVKTNWGQNTPETKLTQTGSDTYQLTISPSIRTYYGVPASEEILKMAFVFRSATQVGGVWLEGKTETGGDIFYEVYEATLNVSILTPSVQPLIVESGAAIDVAVAASLADQITLYLNGEAIQSVTSNSLTTTIYTETLPEAGTYWLKAIAQNATTTAADSSSFFIRPPLVVADLPAQVQTDGITYIDDNTAVLSLYAPEKQHVFVLGDFNQWQLDLESYMNQTPDGKRWWVWLDNLVPQQEYAYQYLVDGDLRIADPYCHKILDAWNDSYIDDETYPDLKPYPAGQAPGIVSVLQTAQPNYAWQNNDFVAPAPRDMVIYELLLRDFIGAHNFNTLRDTLDYLQRLGINTLQLMPLTEFEGNISWGYNISFGMALDKYYGTPDALKALIDECHGRGIAVVLDAVFNHHFGESPLVRLYWDAALNQPAANSPWFNAVAKHDFNVGYDFNHESPATRQYVTDALRYWLSEYRFDGFRFDLSKGFTQNNTLGNIDAWGQYDASRIAIWRALRDSVWTTHPDTRLILEHFAADTEEITLAADGFMLWGNMNHAYNEATMGWNTNSNFARVSYKVRNFDNPHLVGYMESHDEERLMFKNLNYGNNSVSSHNARNLNTALSRLELANTFFLSVPGPKMIWQFGELGYDYSIDYDCRVCPKPIRWDYANNPYRQHLYQTVAALNRVRANYAVFSTDDFSMATAGALKRIALNGSDMKATILGNFDVNPGNINPNFQQAGWWYEFFSGDSINVANTTATIPLQAGEYRLYTTQRLETPDISPIVGIQPAAAPTAAPRLLNRAYPNPVQYEGCTVEIELPRPERVRLDIINANGQIVATLLEAQLSSGTHQAAWNGTSNRQQALPNGAYWCVLQTQSGRYDMLPLLLQR